MLGSIFKGMAGMLAYSRGLSNISGNVANMNTPGFKRSEIHFQNLVYGEEIGSKSSQREFRGGGNAGVDASLMSIIYSQGELRESDNNTDMAIDGNGFFILRNDGEEYYTRVGQFEFNENGTLVDKSHGYEVASLRGSSMLGNINLRDFRSVNPSATSLVTLLGKLSTGSTTHTVSDIEVYDSDGTKHTLSLKFTNNGANTVRSWLVSVENSAGDSLASNLEVRFNPNGSPASNFNNISFQLTSESGIVSDISINIGDAGSFNQVTSTSIGTTSTVKVEQADGYGPGIMSGFEINEFGEIEVEYSNGETKIVSQIALARFESPEDLIDEGRGLLSAQSFQKAIVGSSNSLGLGSIFGGAVELSNVDLTSQFSDMIVIQRGYQASSQVLTSSNEMLQQLIDATKSR